MDIDVRMQKQLNIKMYSLKKPQNSQEDEDTSAGAPAITAIVEGKILKSAIQNSWKEKSISWD